MVEGLGHPRVQALSGFLGGHKGAPVNIRWHTHHELARERLVRIFLTLGAEGEIILNRVGQGLLQGFDRAALESNDIARVDDLTVKQSGIVVKRPTGFVLPRLSELKNALPDLITTVAKEQKWSDDRVTRVKWS